MALPTNRRTRLPAYARVLNLLQCSVLTNKRKGFLGKSGLTRNVSTFSFFLFFFQNIEDFIPPSQDADDRLSYLESILAASALRPHTCEVLRNVWTFPSEQHLAGSISAVLPVADSVPENERQELTEAMSAEMLRRCRKSPAGFSAEFDVYVVHASRSAASSPPQ
ncbi:hypothetical protein MRX96_004761 [Rhipicephalus microplus]